MYQEDADEKTARLTREQAEYDDALEELVRCVLSNTRIDPKYKGKEIEFFQTYEAEVTPEHVKSFRQGNYYQAFNYFYNIWKDLPPDTRPELYRITYMLIKLSKSTHSMYREIEHAESQSKKPLDDLSILRRAPFLSRCNYGPHTSHFNVDDVGAALNEYLDIGIEAPFVDRIVLKMSISNAYELEKLKKKDLSERFAEKVFGQLSYSSIFAAAFLKILSGLIPIVLYLGIDLWIVWASLGHLSGEKFSYWAYIGLFYVATSGIIMLIHLGMKSTREAIEALARPSAPSTYTPSINIDLWAMNGAVNDYVSGHINLRLIREQLTRLQNTDIKLPVQLLTLIDRSIAKGEYYW
jgi:hypothetical protein